MQLGMIGLGRMGANMVRRLLRAGHECVVHDAAAGAAAALAAEGATAAASPADLAARLRAPRAVWMMVPAAAVDAAIGGIAPHLGRGDVLVDGGNSFHGDDRRRAAELAPAGISYVDVGTSGGVHGLERGYCLMAGGEADAVRRLEPAFRALAPGSGAAPPTPGRGGRGDGAEQGWLHCGPSGAGHFVKMVHNGIEYGMMAAYAEGFAILQRAQPYDFDLAGIAELWRRGSVVSSWLLDLTAAALAGDPRLAGFSGRVADSGEGRWTVQAAVDEGVPAPVITAALYQRFASRGEADFADKVLSAMRLAFGGHVEGKP